MASGFDAGTLSIRNLVAAGLSAYGVIKTIQGSVEKLNTAIAAGSWTGRIAGYTGVSTEFMSNFAKGAQSLTGADEGRTQQTMFQLQQFVEAVKYGRMNEQQAEFFNRLGGLGEMLDRTKSPEQMLTQLINSLHDKLAPMGQPEAQFFGGQLGLEDRLTEAIQKFTRQQVVGRGATFGITAEQADMFKRLEEAIRNFNLAWDKFVRKVIEDNPQLISSLNAVSHFFLELEQSPEKMKLVETGLTVIIGLIGVRLVAAIGTFVAATVAASARFAASPLGALLLAGAGLRTFIVEPTKQQYEAHQNDPTRVLDPRYWLGIGPYAKPTPDAAAGRRPGDAGFGAIPPPTSTPPAGRSILDRLLGRGATYTPAQMRQLAEQAGFKGDDAVKMAAIAMSESRGNPTAHNTTYPDDSYGLTQINARAHGDVAKEALDPKRAFELAYRISKGGTDFTPWTDYKSGAYMKHMPAAALPVPQQDVKPSGIKDISSEAGIKGSGPMTGVEGMIVHHTAGGNNVNQVLDVFRNRGVASNFIIDREGNTFQVLPDQVAGRHIMQGWGPKGIGKSNQNMEGVEIIAKDDKDVTDIQKWAAEQLIAQRAAKYGYDPKTSVFGHGEVNPGHRQDSEGMKVTSAVRAGEFGPGMLDRIGNFASGLSLVRSATAADRAGGFAPAASGTNNDIDIGDIHVHTPATDAAGIARDMSDAVRRHLDVTNSNSGLEY